MQIITRVSWSGSGFHAHPGDTIEVSDAVGAARIAAGLAVPGPGETAPLPLPRRQRKERAGQVVETTALQPATERR